MSDSLERELRARELERIVRAAREFTASRLTLAREMEGLTLKELADKIDATPSAVGQFESGVTKPKIETIIRLSLALGVPPEFFSAPPLPVLAEEQCHFRSLRSTTVKERRQVLASGSLLRSVVDYFREYVNFPPDRLSSLRELWSGLPDPNALALRLRDIWALGHGPISNMVGLLEANGVIVVDVPGHSKRLDAFSIWTDDVPMVFLTVEKESSSRRRFDAAHELGHLLMHSGCRPGDAAAEAQADAFASAFLLPREPFMAECPRRLDWDRLRALKRRWGVSLAAIVRRAFDLGLFTEATYRRAYSYLNQIGWRMSEPDEPAMERPSLLQRSFSLLKGAGLTLRQLSTDLYLNEARVERLISPVPEKQFALGLP